MRYIVKNVATIEGISVERLVRLFRDDVQKLYELPKGVISNRGSQFAVELTKELNRILGIKMGLSIAFYLQTNGQTEQIN